MHGVILEVPGSVFEWIVDTSFGHGAINFDTVPHNSTQVFNSNQGIFHKAFAAPPHKYLDTALAAGAAIHQVIFRPTILPK